MKYTHKYTHFTDIEEVVKWTYDNDNLFYDKNNPYSGNEETLGQSGTADNIRKMFNYPGPQILQKGSFEEMNIAVLLMCINNAQDKTRPAVNREFLAMTSTSKKVINILLLGRILDGEATDGSFVVLEEKATEQYKDTHQVLYEYFKEIYKLAERPNGGIKTIKYFPGRTVSYAQICNASKKFKNNIKDEGIQGGLDELVEYGFVKCVDKNKGLYKLDFKECKKFLDKCKWE